MPVFRLGHIGIVAYFRYSQIWHDSCFIIINAVVNIGEGGIFNE